MSARTPYDPVGLVLTKIDGLVLGHEVAVEPQAHDAVGLTGRV